MSPRVGGFTEGGLTSPPHGNTEARQQKERGLGRLFQCYSTQTEFDRESQARNAAERRFAELSWGARKSLTPAANADLATQTTLNLADVQKTTPSEHHWQGWALWAPASDRQPEIRAYLGSNL